MRLARRIAALERMMRASCDRWLDNLTGAELEALAASFPPSDLSREIATWTEAQLEAADRGVPLEDVRAMQTDRY